MKLESGRLRALFIAGAAALLLVWSAAPVQAQDTAYVQIPGIPGESTDAAHLDWIVAYATSGGASSAGGLPDFQDFSLLKGTDLSTPVLADAMAQQTNLGLVTIEVCRDNAGTQECYYTVRLNNARVSSMNLSGSSCIDPATSCVPGQTESVTLAFTAITTVYVKFGKGGGTTCSCWDLAKGVTCGC